ncbi:MAG: TrmH family RNA methyltransferase [Chitinispirillaceae bacterium]
MRSRVSTLRKRANEIKPYICKYLIAVIENPCDIKNIGTVIRNVNALGVQKTYIVDPRKTLPDDWQKMRDRKSLNTTSVSAVKWSYVKRFDSTEQCFSHLEKNRYISIATSPHIKGKENFVLHDADYTCPRLAVWFGNEKRGVSDLVLENCEFCVSIPMFGIIESLNLGTSTGIVLYEITKQRREYQEKYKRANSKRPRKINKD